VSIQLSDKSFHSGSQGNDSLGVSTEPEPEFIPDTHMFQKSSMDLDHGEQDEFAEEKEKIYKDRLESRRKKETALQERLQKLQSMNAKPYDTTAQFCFLAGTLALLLSACLLVYGRFAVYPVVLPGGLVPPRKLAACAFIVPAGTTVLSLIYIEYMHWIERRQDVLERRRPEQNGYAKQDNTPYWITYSVITILVISALVLMIVALVTFDPAQLRSDNGAGFVSGNMYDTVQNIPFLVGSPLNLKDGQMWPSFWDPTGAAWWPQRRSLLLAGGKNS